jgi:hypothetical protein
MLKNRIAGCDIGPKKATFGPRVMATVYSVLAVAVLLPVFAVKAPCLNDYFNHLARIHVLTTIDASPALQKFYESDWRLVPYLGMDVTVAALARVMPLHDAGRLFIGLCIIMPPLAAAALHYVTHRRPSLAPALGFLLSYNFMLALGFATFLFSAGLAVILFAAWIATEGWKRWLRPVLFGAAAVLLYFSHPFAFAAYGIMVAGYELGKAARSRTPLSHRLATIGLAASQAAPVIALLPMSVQNANTVFTGGESFEFASLLDRISALIISPLYFPGNETIAFVGWAAPVLGLALIVRVRLAPSLWPSLLALAVVAFCTPRWLFNVWGADYRLPLIAAVVLIASLSPGPRMTRPLTASLFMIVVCLVAARSWDATATLRRLDAKVEQVREVLAALPAGMRLLVVDDSPRSMPQALASHAGLLATIDRDAFVPFLFTGITAVRIRPELTELWSPNANAVTSNELWDGFLRSDPPQGRPSTPNGGKVYWLGWPEKFDYVLVIHFDTQIEKLPPVLKTIASNGSADLYKIDKP